LLVVKELKTARSYGILKQNGGVEIWGGVQLVKGKKRTEAENPTGQKKWEKKNNAPIVHGGYTEGNKHSRKWGKKRVDVRGC